MRSQYNRGVHYFALATALLSLALIALGAYVSSSGYGLAIADWPTSMGTLIPSNLTGGILYEFWHRMLSALVGAMTLLLGLHLYTRDARPEVQRLGLTAGGLIVLQIVVGGVGVLFLFPSLVKILHASLAHVFFAVAVSLVAFASPIDPSSLEFSDKTVRRTRGLAYMVLAQVILGAVVRHAAGAVYAGALLLHLVLALGVIVSGATTGAAILKEARPTALKAAAGLVVLLVVVQLLVGIGVLVTAPPPDQVVGQPPKGYVGQSVLHVAGGALLLGLSVYMCLFTTRAKRRT